MQLSYLWPWSAGMQTNILSAPLRRVPSHRGASRCDLRVPNFGHVALPREEVSLDRHRIAVDLESGYARRVRNVIWSQQHQANESTNLFRFLPRSVHSSSSPFGLVPNPIELFRRCVAT